MSDTPISDSTPHNVADRGMLCRRLERELNDTPRMDASHYDDGVIWNTGRQLERELNAANERIKRLEEVGDALSETQTYDLIQNINWRKAKEAKL